LALWHIGGLAITFRTLYSGAQTVFPTPNITLATQIQQEKITHLSLVPTQLHRLLQEKGDISSLKGILVGGGPIPPSLIETARKRNLPVYTTYGMTELGSQFCTTPPLANLQMLKTAGKPLQGWTIHIATNGEICAKGTPLFLGYVHGETLSHPFDNNGFFHTGDRGSIDALGLLHVLGRCDQMFISGGENIHPEEIERCLCDIPHLEAALVIAIENPEYGMRPVSFIKGDINKRDIITHLTKRLPKFKHPDLFFMWPAQLSTKKPSREKAEKLLSQAILIK
jgi:O-succinylbenzoic acid--CoA ligase